MSTPPSSDVVVKVAKPPAPSPSLKVYDFDFAATKFEMDASVSEEERRFYLKMYPSVDVINQRRVHCTVCRTHIGTAPNSESNMKMHPILRVTHCVKCHDFYNSGEFSKGEDGSELYCRWCGQGGEVYCCSTCPFVFCKSCIIKNLSRGVIVDIEQNENWNCFKCHSKILWPLRAQHWALVNYIETQKNGLQSMPLPPEELQGLMNRDSATCCRQAKAKASSLSDSMESLESNASKRSHASSVNSGKKLAKQQGPPAKRPKSSNDEVVCTPDLLSMLEPDCQISVAQKTPQRIAAPAPPVTTSPRIVSVQQNYTGPSPSTSASSNGNSPAIPHSSLPPPLVLSSSGMRYRQAPPAPASVVRRTVVPNAVRSAGPVFHTINGFRVDLNSAAQQDSFRLPNGRLIQVKRQVPFGAQPSTSLSSAPLPVTPQVIIRQRPALPPRMMHNSPGYGSNMGIYNPQTNQHQRAPQVVRVNNGSQAPANLPAPAPPMNSNGGTTIMLTPGAAAKGPTLVRHVFPNTTIGTARSQLQEQIFSAMEICTHLTGKVQTLTHSNAYTQARSYLDLKELYIHLSYLMTYAIGRFKQLQDKCLVDMREMGFKNDANSLENGQLAAAVDYVCYGQLDDVDLFNTGCNSFHNQVYEYRKSLHANLKDDETVEPLPPLMPLGVRAEGDPTDEDDEPETIQDVDNENDGPEDYDDDDDNQNNDADDIDDDDDLDDDYDALGTEESMNRNEQAHAYDRKLTRLLREYPSIWCTRHPDYGKMEVTRKQWRVIASHFPRGDDIKLRWKNVRKRYVRIERLLKLGRRFKGYFDKATNYLTNRDLPRSEWLPVDCGEDDGDGFERKQLDAIENTIHKEPHENDKLGRQTPRLPVRPLELRPIDLRIINFAKSHPVLWRKSADPEFNSIDEQTRKSLWQNFWKSAPNKQASDDEDNEIEILEPTTDTITIDSDNEDEKPSTSGQNSHKGLKILSVQSSAPGAAELVTANSIPANIDPGMDMDVAAFSSSILASLLEVDITEGNGEVKTVEPKPVKVKSKLTGAPGAWQLTPGTVQKKQPRKKTTNKPNPALLHLERQRMEEIKMNSAKLKMKVAVKLRRAEDEFEVARIWAEKQDRIAKEKRKQQILADEKNVEAQSVNSSTTELTKLLENNIEQNASVKDHKNTDESENMDTSVNPKPLIDKSSKVEAKTSEQQIEPDRNKGAKDMNISDSNVANEQTKDMDTLESNDVSEDAGDMDTLESNETLSSKQSEPTKTNDEKNATEEVLETIETLVSKDSDATKTNDEKDVKEEEKLESFVEKEVADIPKGLTTESLEDTTSVVNETDVTDAPNESDTNDAEPAEKDDQSAEATGSYDDESTGDRVTKDIPEILDEIPADTALDEPVSIKTADKQISNNILAEKAYENTDSDNSNMESETRATKGDVDTVDILPETCSQSAESVLKMDVKESSEAMIQCSTEEDSELSSIPQPGPTTDAF